MPPGFNDQSPVLIYICEPASYHDYLATSDLHSIKRSFSPYELAASHCWRTVS
jgi:hypothetical protein